MDNLNAAMIGRVRLPRPPLPEQHKIMNCIASEAKVISLAAASAQRQIELVREYCTRLIADVVTGKLDVREAAADLPDEPDEDAEGIGEAAEPGEEGEPGLPLEGGEDG